MGWAGSVWRGGPCFCGEGIVFVEWLLTGSLEIWGPGIRE